MTTCGMHLATQPHRIAAAPAPMAGDRVGTVRRGALSGCTSKVCSAAQPSESRPIIMKAVTAEAEATQDYSTAA